MSTELTTTNQVDAFMGLVDKLSAMPNLDPVKLTAILDQQERVMKKQAEIVFNQQMAAMAAVMPRIIKNGVIDLGNGKGKIPFAKYEDIDTAVRPLMIEHGLSISFSSKQRDGGGLIVEATLSHVMGHFRTACLPLPLDDKGAKSNIQGIGSTLSYGKRYLLCMLLNIVTENEDDDGKLGSTEFASKEQIAEVEKLLVESKADKDRFMQAFNIALLDNLTIQDYEKAVSQLKAKIAKNASAS